ncbi:MAG TPA: exodeoxyribonuclease V subunit gamma, partial [Aquella sp.]|nr:exodeoxyribonuclease V subunit gamma [Aquella sp.]
YIYVNGSLDKLRVYQLATQLQKIFHEYIYLRTEDLINLDKSAIKPWQKEIIRHLFAHIGKATTFLDVYKYFMTTNLDTIKLPANLMIFGLTSIYPSQLKLLCSLSAKINIYWYYQTSSYQYYGDLLSDKAKSKLEQKLLKKPDLNLEDLYLQEGNPLLANLAQQSREFTELLIANDIDVYMFDQPKSESATTILKQIQEDIRDIKYRIEPDYRFGNNPDIYANPITLLKDPKTKSIYDLPNKQTSIKINSCHNHMREVQVMFNELLGVLNKNPVTRLSDILITAPDIDDYAPYIAAVFDNEMVNGEKLLYNITGNRKYKNYKILETLKILLNAPYVLTVNYFIEVLTQSEIQESLAITAADVDMVRKWLHDNKTHFGYDERDYAVLGYANYQIHSFKQFLNNIVLGACISENVWNGYVPLYTAYSGEDANIKHDSNTYIPYDNLDNNQVKLCNKLIILINQLEELRDKFYVDATNYKELTIREIHTVLTKLHENCLKAVSFPWMRESTLYKETIIQRFLGELLVIPEDLIISLPILNLMLDEYIEDFKSSFMFNGSITCASMRYMRNIPFKHIYVLGLNFGEYPG